MGIAPLLTFRILFGGLMLFGALRFAYQGWIERLYLEPKFFFKFYGFEWVQPLGETGMYLLFAAIALSALLILLGLFYRFASILFFCTFTYVELIDATNYLNHYYLVCLLAFLLIFLPANRAFSLDVWRKPSLKVAKVPAWTINIIIFQLTVVYCCAGIAKLNPDWLWHAMPLKVWLLERSNTPVLGYFFQFPQTAYLFSWAGAFYDLTIAFFLLHKTTRPFAYLAVLGFHLMTQLLFNIGLFPQIMIFSTLIFFSPAFHERLLGLIGYNPEGNATFAPHNRSMALIRPVLALFVVLQIALPFRHLFYPGNLLWTEEAYRFSWRVMLVEKAGLITFSVKDSASEKKSEIINGRYLTRFQEKQLSIQPDFILQFAHFLSDQYQQQYQYINPIVTANAHVALNGRASQQFIDPNINLAQVEDGFLPKKWVLPLRE